jgi:hypothetical protein
MGLPACLTWTLKSVCSKRGPVIACVRGFWLRDQMPTRLGAWFSSFGADSSRVAGVESVLEAAGTVAANRGAEVVNVRPETRRLRASTLEARNWVAAIFNS